MNTVFTAKTQRAQSIFFVSVEEFLRVLGVFAVSFVSYGWTLVYLVNRGAARRLYPQE
jgi:hypothetical protein